MRSADIQWLLGIMNTIIYAVFPTTMFIGSTVFPSEVDLVDEWYDGVDGGCLVIHINIKPMFHACVITIGCPSKYNTVFFSHRIRGIHWHVARGIYCNGCFCVSPFSVFTPTVWYQIDIIGYITLVWECNILNIIFER